MIITGSQPEVAILEHLARAVRKSTRGEVCGIRHGKCYTAWDPEDAHPFELRDETGQLVWMEQ
jgi:hypothetical protein